LQAFSNSVWQRHEAASHRPARPWPTAGAFKANWPLLANDLLVAAWKIEGAAALEEAAEIDEALLDPPSAPELDWRETYAAELASFPLLLADLGHKQGDGVELVLERAGLTARERLVIRPWLAGDDPRSIAAALRLRPQSVTLVLMNARARLGDLRWANAPRRRASRGSAEMATAS